MLKVKKGKLEELTKHGFKYGTREKLIYKTTKNGLEAKMYVDLQPCHNNNNELKIENSSFSMPEKIADKLYDLLKADLVEKVEG